MRPLVIAVLLTASAVQARQSGRAPRGEVDNVAAFARLYGVVRFFFPSDGAASLDWNRFAVEGVRQVRAARDAQALDAALERLFGPLGPGIEIDAKLTPRPAPARSDERLVAWRYFGPGFDGSHLSGPYRGKRTSRSQPTGPGIDGFVTLMQTVSSEKLAGRTIRLRGQVRATVRGGQGSAPARRGVRREQA